LKEQTLKVQELVLVFWNSSQRFEFW